MSNRSELSSTTVYSDCRPWSRISKKRWRNSAVDDLLKASKTTWPVPQIEQIFLPEFKIKTETNEESFEIIEFICKGAFGKVFKVKQLDSNEVYAMKILKKSAIIEENGIQQVKDEVHIQSMCGHHPFIINCPFYWQSRKQLFIVSNYVGGGELLKLLLQHEILPEELCRIYFAEIVTILDFLHNAGVIYRDIKPENILLDDDGHLQLIDFGLSKWLPQGCRTNTICGTSQYMAPEILQMGNYNHSVDWWSAGVLLFQLLTNQYPPKTHDEIRTALDHVSKGATDMVLKLLETNPQYRLKSLRQAKIQPFFHGFDFSEVISKKVKPNEILQRYSNVKRTHEKKELPNFDEFDS
ncbi:ribosomal protein S6 kinase-related protein isoform X2 [Adelges cooleyi]|uniref:ribosomal protein S6 kinase-related protein isoform X2 n=1 Tax=Adelges cooleyi TaxID=133065 RepID=UPI0021807F78|nr:ribosomal protein S6 kinase-related protein isoform X2 [Adelges cooleyi]